MSGPERIAKIELQDRSRILLSQTISLLRHLPRAGGFDDVNSICQSFATHESALNSINDTLKSMELTTNQMHKMVNEMGTSFQVTNEMVDSTTKSVQRLKKSLPITPDLANQLNSEKLQ
eukprot:c9582_g1_i1.p1 GENE.c9582_g1_i1~~c9582_g1_i1.p1  ORF type:complete len:119 (+),score=44.77 c9582_g1_i1:46-402(+)